MRTASVTACLILASLGAAPLSLSEQHDADVNSFVTLQDYLRYAALNSAALKASFENWKAALEQIPQAKSLPDPTFTYGYFIKEVETRVGPQRQKFEIMQMFPWFGTIEARTDQAAAKAKAAQKRYEAKKLQLFEQVKEAFYEYVYLASAISITTENLELLKHFEEVARTKYATATTSHPDIIRAQIELAIVEDRLSSLQRLRPALTAKLNAILNRPADSFLPWPKVPEWQPISLDFEQIVGLIAKNNPDIQAIENEVQAARSTQVLAAKKSFPNVGLGVSYIDTAHALASGVDDSGKDPIIAMISLTLPLWSEKNEALQRQTRAQLSQKTSERTELENTLESRAKELLYEFEDSSRKIVLYRDVVIPKAREMVSTSETAYKAGTIDFLSLIDAQRMLLQHRLFYERHLAKRTQMLAKIERLAGTELSVTQTDQYSD